MSTRSDDFEKKPKGGRRIKNIRHVESDSDEYDDRNESQDEREAYEEFLQMPPPPPKYDKINATMDWFVTLATYEKRFPQNKDVLLYTNGVAGCVAVFLASEDGRALGHIYSGWYNTIPRPTELPKALAGQLLLAKKNFKNVTGGAVQKFYICAGNDSDEGFITLMINWAEDDDSHKHSRPS